MTLDTIDSNRNEKLFPRNSDLINNKAYSLFMPRIIIGVSIFYLCALLIAYLIKRQRKNRQKRELVEKDQLKCIWQKSMIKFQLMKSKDITHPHIVHSYSPTSSSSLTLNSSNATIAQPQEYLKRKVVINLSPLRNSLRQHKMSRSKQLNLLWQWGSSRGYCEYNHAKKLNAYIVQLQQNKHDKSAPITGIQEQQQ